MKENIQLKQKKPRKRKIITAVIFFIIFLAIVYFGWAEYNQWWKARKEYVRMGLAEDKFPYRMYTERELIEMGRWPVESKYYDSIPTRTTPEETYAKFRQALIDEDSDKAAECFIDEKRDTVRKGLVDIFGDKQLKDQMLEDLPIKIDSIDIIGRSSVYYDYSIIREGKKIAQTMSFVKSLNGDWLIEDL